MTGVSKEEMRCDMWKSTNRAPCQMTAYYGQISTVNSRSYSVMKSQLLCAYLA